MNRRQFLSGCGAVAAAGAVGAPMPLKVASDDFTYRGYRVRWMGWREPANQLLTFGVWFAHKAGQMYVSTTMGVVARHYHELDVIDCSHVPGWPVLNETSTQNEREAVKTRACSALLETLRALV